MKPRYLLQMAVFILLVSAAFSFCLVPEANGYLNCSEECGKTLTSDLAACATYQNEVYRKMCNGGAYMQYGACLGVCNTVGRLSHWLGYYPPGIVIYDPTEIKKIGFQRLDSTGVLQGPAAITNVEIYIIACDDIDTTLELTSMAFDYLGTAVYNGETNAWELDWNTDSYDSQGGYLIMADYLDPETEGGEGFGMILAMMPSQQVPILNKWGLPALIILILLSGLIMIYIKFKNRLKECS